MKSEISVTRSDLYQDAFAKLSLPLSNEQNDRLVWLLVENVAAAERSGFYGAFAFLKGHGGGAN